MLENLPIYCDGSDGSIWQLDKAEWSRILSGEVDATTRFVRVSDVIALVQKLKPTPSPKPEFLSID